MKKYPKYKMTNDEWITQIPYHWDESKICYVSNIENSGIWGDDDAFEKSCGVLIPTTAQLSMDGIWDIPSMTTRYLTEDEYDRYICKEGDTVVVKASGSSTNIITGKCGYVGKNEDSQFGFGNFLLRVRPTKAEPKFVFYFLFSHVTKMRIEKMVSATTYPNLKVEEYNKSLIFIPPLPEQQQIVTYLDQKTTLIDQIISGSEKKIELLKEQRTATINHAVTKGLNPKVKMKDSGVEWIGEICWSWDYLPIKHLLKRKKNSMRTGPFGSELKSEDFIESGIKVYNQRTVYDENFKQGDLYISEVKFLRLKEFEVFANDFLVTSRGTIGKGAIVPENAERGILHPCLIKLVLNNQLLLNEYLWWYVNHSSLFIESVKYQSNSTTIEVIYSDTLKNLKIPCPPLPEQQQIVTYLDQKTKEIDDLISSEQKRIELMKEYRQSLISEVVTGKIKVTNE